VYVPRVMPAARCFCAIAMRRAMSIKSVSSPCATSSSSHLRGFPCRCSSCSLRVASKTATNGKCFVVTYDLASIQDVDRFDSFTAGNDARES
jgi:hypothetical protein